MKRLLAFLFFFAVSWNYAQDTLYLPVPGLGHEKFVLKDNGTFEYSSYLCGSVFLSFGIYEQNVFGYKFNCDTTICPSPFIVEASDDSNNDSITLLFHDLLPNKRKPFIGTFLIGEQSYSCSSDSITLSKHNFESNILEIKKNGDNVSFDFDSSSTQLQVFFNVTGSTYDCGINRVKSLRKTRKGYLDKFNVIDEIRDKPWKKGKRRVVRHYYGLLKSG